MQFIYDAFTLSCIRLKFEWDDTKEIENRRKHGVAFEDAKVAFDDVFARVIADPDHSLGEERFILLGMNVNQLLVVCHCEVAPDVIRIISARRASRHERTEYEGFRHAWPLRLFGFEAEPLRQA